MIDTANRGGLLMM